MEKGPDCAHVADMARALTTSPQMTILFLCPPVGLPTASTRIIIEELSSGYGTHFVHMHCGLEVLRN